MEVYKRQVFSFGDFSEGTLDVCHHPVMAASVSHGVALAGRELAV